MPKIYRVVLSEEQRGELNRRARARTLAPRLRERLEMVRLSDLGWRVPRIAGALGAHGQTVRKHIKAFLAAGFAGLADRPIPGRAPRAGAADLAALGRLLDEAATRGQTWTAPQLAAWLARERGVRLSTSRLRALLRRHRFRWKRTKRSVRHSRKDPDLQAAKEADLELLRFCGAWLPRGESTCTTWTRRGSSPPCR
jgi:transposase